MIRLAIISSVLFALCPVAHAQPRDYDEHRRGEYDRDRDHDRWRPYDWMTIGAGDLDRGGSKYMVGAGAGSFHQLRIQATRGEPLVRRIEVRFVDNTLQTIEVHRRLRTGEELHADLQCTDCTISSIAVLGRPDRGAHVAIAAR